MNTLRLSARRAAAVAAGLALGVGGALSIATAPAHAEEITPNPEGKGVVNCTTLTVSPDREGQDGLHAWRVVFQSGEGDQVVWRSGDWKSGADLGDDNQALIDQGWAVNDFTAALELDGLPNGTFVVEWWKHTAATPKWVRYTTGQPIEWVRKYEVPCGWVGTLTVTQPTCENPAGVIEIPEANPEDQYGPGNVTYLIDGEVAAPGPHELEPGTYEVTALRVGGKKNYAKKWTVEIVPPDCPTPSPSPEPEDGGEGGGLPQTGTSTMLFAGGAVGLLALGGGLYLAARRRRVTFTA